MSKKVKQAHKRGLLWIKKKSNLCLIGDAIDSCGIV